MFNNDQLNSLYNLLDGDMIEVDCGVKCEKYCCRAADAVKYFLPGEAEFFRSQNFLLVDHYLFTGYSAANGRECACTRQLRPFCCRIFPFRPVIDPDRRLVTDLQKARGAGFDLHCWVLEPLKEWRENALEAWQFVLSDEDNLRFYARYSLFLREARKRSDLSTSSVLYKVAEEMTKMTEVALWQAAAIFFSILGRAPAEWDF